ncbi:MAG TPA: ATP-binding protein, partial [Myxococcota bacterium]
MADDDPHSVMARQQRVIDVLIRRVEALENSDRGGRLSQQVELERIVSLKTRELAEEKRKLADTLHQLSEMQGQLVQAQKLEAMAHLAAGIAHEINTPIQFVSDNMTFLSEAFVDLVGVASAGARLADGDGDPDAVLAAADDADLDYLQKTVPTAFAQCADGLRRVAAIVSSM